MTLVLDLFRTYLDYRELTDARMCPEGFVS
nr:MAG TPA: hypothetical protein [Caudoviricetes sp.]